MLKTHKNKIGEEEKQTRSAASAPSVWGNKAGRSEKTQMLFS
jgi:hypothetical protein